MNKKKGFSLVELIAVIVILAIILVIAVPRILVTIDETDKKAFTSDLNELIGTSKLEYNEKLSGVSKDVWYYFEDGKQVDYDISGQLHFKGNTPLRGYILVTKNGEVELELTSHNGKYCASKELEDKHATIDKCEVKEQEPFELQLRTTNTTNSIRVDVVNPTDLTVFYYKIKENPADEVEFESSDKNYRVYNNLKKNKTYYITVRGCRKKEVVCDEKTVEVTLPDLNNPTFTIKSTPADQIESQGWATSREVTINYAQDDSTLTEYKDLKKQYLYASTVDEISQKVFNNEWTDCEKESCTIQPAFTSDTFVIARITDGTNEIGKITQKLTNFDTVPPTTPEITGGSNNWSSTNRTISVSAPSKAKSGIKKYQYYVSTSTDKPEKEDNAWTDCSYSKTSQIFIEDGTYYVYFRAISYVDLKSDASSYQVVKIDTGVPTAPEITGGSNSWINGNRTISVSTESKSLSGINHYQYYISTSASGQAGGKWIDLPANQKSQVITTEGTRYIYFRAINNAGTTGKISLPQVTKIDTGVPTAPEITGGSTDWTKGSRTIKVSKESTSTSGIKHYQYYVSTSSTGQTGGTWTDCTTSKSSQTITTEGTYYVYFRAVNNAGTPGKVSTYQVVKIDKQIPTAPELTGGSNAWINGNRTISVSTPSTAPSGIKKYQYYVSTSSTSQTGGAWTDCTSTTSPSYTETSNGTHYIYFRAISNSDVTGEVSKPQVAKIDKTSISVSLSANQITSGDKISSGTWSDEGLKFTLTKGTTGPSGYTIYYCADTANTCSPTTVATSGTAITTWQTTQGTYYFRYYIKSGSGISTTVASYTAKVDTTKPTLSIAATKVTAGTAVATNTWSNEGLNFKLIAGTTGSSGATIYYCKDTANTCSPTTKATSGTSITGYNTLTGTYYIRYYIKGGSGISSAVASYTAKVDTTKPTVSITAKKKTAGTAVATNTWSDDGLNFTLTKGTTGSSGYTIYYCKDTANTCVPTTKATSGTAITDYNTLTGTYYIRYYIKTGAGNSSAVASYTAKIDTVIPTVSITAKKKTAGTAVSSGAWSNEGLNFTLTAGTTGASGYTIYYCQDTANTCVPTTKATSGTAITAHNTLTGTYYIRYYIKGGYGNATTAASYTAKIDTTVPTVTLVAKKKTAGTTVATNTWSDDGLHFTLTKGTTGASGYTIYYCADRDNTCSPTTKETSGTAITTWQTTEGIYYFRYYIKTGAGNSSAVASYTAKADTVIPEVDITAKKKTAGTEIGSGTWSSEGLNFTFTATKTGTSGGTIYYCKDTANTCIPTTVATAGTAITTYNTTEGTYYIRYYIKGGSGNAATTKSYKATVDTKGIGVELTATKATSGTVVASGKWSNEGLNFKFTAGSTTGSSGYTIYYCKDTANTCSPTTVATNGASITGYNTLTGTYYIRYYIKTGAGISSKVASYTAKIDTTKPTMSITAKKKTAGTAVATNTWSNEGLNFTFTKGTTGASGYTMYYCQDTTNACSPTTIATTGTAITAHNTLTGTYYIKYKIVTGAGNSASGTYTAKVDTTTPTVSITAKKKTAGTTVATNTWSNEGLNFTFTKGTTGSSGYKIYYCKDTTNKCDPKESTTGYGSGATITDHNTLTGTYYIRYYIKGGSEISSEVKSYTAKVDTTVPTVTLSAKKVTAGTAVSSGAWSNQGLNFTLTKGTTGSSGYTIYYCADRDNACSPTTVATSGTAITTWKSTTGTYYFRYKIVTGAGNSASGTYTAKVDTTVPTVTLSATKVTAGTAVSSGAWSNQGLNFTLTKGTTGSSGYTIYYCADRDNACSPTTVATSGTAITTWKSTTGTYYFRYKIVTGAGNSASGTYTAKVDTTAPPGPSSGLRYDSSTGTVRTNANSWTNKTLWWGSFSATDTGGSGTDHYEYSTSCSGSKSGNLSTSHTYKDNYNQYYCIRSVDKAGNASAWSGAYYIKVDKTAPPVPSSVLRYDSSTGTVRTNANSWTNKTLWWGSFSATDTGGSGTDHYEYSTSCSGSKSGNLSTSHTYSNDYNQYYCIRSVDKAGNASAWSGAYYIKVDKSAPTKPTYSAYFKDNTSSTYTSGAWTNKTVHIKISSTDAASGVSYIQYSTSSTATTGTKFTFPISALTKSGTTATGTDEWTLKNRNDTYYIRAVDAVGNVSDAVSFTIRYDTTKPTCTSSGGSTAWTSSGRTLKGTCSDTGGSGCKKASVSGRTYDASGHVYWTIDWQGNWSNLSPGTVYDNAGNSASCPGDQTVRVGKYANISYTMYLEDGTTETGLNGTLGGTVGKSKASQRMAISVSTDNTISGSIYYSIHQQNVGDILDYSNGTVIGGSGKRIEKVKVWLTGDLASAFDVYYRVHTQGTGWLNRVANGTWTGSSGLCKRIEAIQIKAVPKGSAAPSFDNSGSSTVTSLDVVTSSANSNCETSSGSSSSCTNQTCYYTATCYKYSGGGTGQSCANQGGSGVSTSNCSGSYSFCCQIPYSCTKSYTCCK